MENKYEIDQKYIKENLKRVLITFNKKKPADMELVDHLQKQPSSMAGYIKGLIREDMEK